MRVLRTIFTTTLLLWSVVATAQQANAGMELFVDVAELLPADVEVQGATQGFAIYGRYGFSMHDKGQCVILDMKRKEFVSTFVLEGNTGHCNNASFGVERYSRESQFPLFYVTECRGNRACYVNDISLTGSRLVQTIYYDGVDITGPADWAVDASARRLYLYCSYGSLRMLKVFKLPTLADSDERGEVHLSARDIICTLPAGEVTIPQGSHVYGRYIYLPDGIPPRPTRLHATNIVTGERLSTIDLSHLGLEPEGVAVKGKWLYVSFHTPRNVRRNVIYRLPVTSRRGYRK